MVMDNDGRNMARYVHHIPFHGGVMSMGSRSVVVVVSGWSRHAGAIILLVAADGEPGWSWNSTGNAADPPACRHDRLRSLTPVPTL